MTWFDAKFASVMCSSESGLLDKDFRCVCVCVFCTCAVMAQLLGICKDGNDDDDK